MSKGKAIGNLLWDLTGNAASGSVAFWAFVGSVLLSPAGNCWCTWLPTRQTSFALWKVWLPLNLIVPRPRELDTPHLLTQLQGFWWEPKEIGIQRWFVKQYEHNPHTGMIIALVLKVLLHSSFSCFISLSYICIYNCMSTWMLGEHICKICDALF